MGERPVLTGVVVHWGRVEPLVELVGAWPEGDRFELVVVDNGGHEDGLPEEVRRRARVVEPGVNLGFGGGANAGVAAARGEWVLVMNPDVRPEPGAVEGLTAALAANGAAGGVPRLVGGGGEGQEGWQLRGLPRRRHLWLQALQVPAAPRRSVGSGEAVEQPAAAALALRREVFEAVGGFDERFHPAWFEDVDLAARLAAAGHRVLFHPEAVFRHRQGDSVGQLGYGRFLWIYQRNLVRYVAKNHGRVAAAVTRALVPVGLVLRAALLPIRRPRRAASRTAALRGLGEALGGALSGWRRPRRWIESPAERIQRGESPGEGGPAGGVGATGIAGAEDGERGPHAAGAVGWLSDGDLSLSSSAVPVPAPVAVCIVTHDDAADVPGCFAALAGLSHRPLEVVVADCASEDGTVAAVERAAEPLRRAGVPVTVLPLGENRGFAGGMNAAVAACGAPWLLSLNADARPSADYLDRLLARAAAHPGLAVGAVTGRLVRPAEDGLPPRLDACGMRLTRTWRHLDRGSSEPDRGQYAVAERVFGGTGAATLFRRAALDDAALDGEPFDARFHSFREDAELAFRLRERGWEVLYEPAAVAEHRRRVLPERRAALPAATNFHSLKNRYLLRLYHQTPRNLLRTALPTAARDLAALAYVLAAERSSLAAYVWLWRHRRELWARRRAIQARRRVPAAEIDRWFGIEGMPL